VSLGKNAHAQLITDDPFVHVAIWIAGMIAESTEIAFLRSINEFRFREGHEIKMFDAFFVIGDGSFPECLLIDYFADVLKNKIVRTQISICSQAIAFLLRPDDGYAGVLFALEALILTVYATIAIAINAFHFSRTVDTVRFFSARIIFAIACTLSALHNIEERTATHSTLQNNRSPKHRDLRNHNTLTHIDSP